MQYDSIRDVVWNDWRLPTTMPIDGSAGNYNYDWKYDGSTDQGYNISAPGTVYSGNVYSEMAYMYYNNLSNLGLYDSNGSEQIGGGLSSLGPFVNYYWDVTNTGYWSSTISGHPNYSQATAFDFSMEKGFQAVAFLDNGTNHAWAVRDGDVGVAPSPAVPEPTTMLLLGTGLIGLAGARRRFKK